MIHRHPWQRGSSLRQCNRVVPGGLYSKHSKIVCIRFDFTPRLYVAATLRSKRWQTLHKGIASRKKRQRCSSPIQSRSVCRKTELSHSLTFATADAVCFVMVHPRRGLRYFIVNEHSRALHQDLFLPSISTQS